jgi:uncharacterized protein
MNIKYYSNATDFLTQTRAYLARDEAVYSLVAGIAGIVAQFPHRYGQDDPWFCSVDTKGEINAAAMRTPPFSVLIAYFSGDKQQVAKKLIEAVSFSFTVIPGVNAEKELGDIFAGLWRRKKGVKIVSSQAQRIYRLDKVNDVPLASGKMRLATMADLELVKKWNHAFNIDCFGPDRNQPEPDPTFGIQQGMVYFWEDGGMPVSKASKSRTSDNGASVGGVYTPPALRRRGYAMSCVAELSRKILQSGKKFCTLRTDLANPTSNSIYREIGYRPLCDAVEHMFG